MKRKMMALGAVLAWVCGVFGATHEGVQLWENGPLWAKTNSGANSPTEAGYRKLAYTAGTANYSATFKHLANYAITYANTKGAANSNPAQYNYDSSITFAALPNVTGYVFNGWNPTKIAAGGFGAKTVMAKWTPISYTVKFNANGGSGTGLGPSLPCGIISGRSAAMAHGKSASSCVSPVVRRHWGCRGPTYDFTSERSDMKSHRCPPLLSSRIMTLFDHSALHP